MAINTHMQKPKNSPHIPVLLEPVVKLAQAKPSEAYLDLTAGYGGHAQAILDVTKAYDKAVLVDQDLEAIAALQSFKKAGASLMHSDFLAASQELKKRGSQFDIILADLGVSSVHLDNAARGFAFSQAGPLDMRMDQRGQMTAGTIVNDWEQPRLAKLIRQYGEEPRANKVASAIVAGRPWQDTTGLASAIAAALPGKRGRVHPATKAFQAIRIAVNDELGQLEHASPIWLELLKPGGRLLVISFHSLEDRIVKRIFADVSGDRFDSSFRLLTKKPISAETNELAFNPRARSAKLRAVAKIKNNFSP